MHGEGYVQHSQVICSAVSRERAADIPIYLLEKYLLPQVWGTQQSAEVTNSKVVCLVQQKKKTTSQNIWSVLVVENELICLRRAWQERIYL